MFLPDGFLRFEDFSGGGFYASAFAAECGDDNGVVEPALCELSKRAQANTAIFIEAAREGVEEKRKPVAVIPYAGIVGGEGRDHVRRYEEKVRLRPALRSLRARARARAAGGDIESSSDDDFIAAAKTKLAVHNRVFMSEPLFIALAMLGGDGRTAATGRGSPPSSRTSRAACALIGGMIKTGGLNVLPPRLRGGAGF